MGQLYISPQTALCRGGPIHILSRFPSHFSVLTSVQRPGLSDLLCQTLISLFFCLPLKVATKWATDGWSHLTCLPSPPASLSSWPSYRSDSQLSLPPNAPLWIYITPGGTAVSLMAIRARRRLSSWGAWVQRQATQGLPGRYLM